MLQKFWYCLYSLYSILCLTRRETQSLFFLTPGRLLRFHSHYEASPVGVAAQIQSVTWPTDTSSANQLFDQDKENNERNENRKYKIRKKDTFEYTPISILLHLLWRCRNDVKSIKPSSCREPEVLYMHCYSHSCTSCDKVIKRSLAFPVTMWVNTNGEKGLFIQSIVSSLKDGFTLSSVSLYSHMSICTVKSYCTVIKFRKFQYVHMLHLWDKIEK